MTQVNVKRRQDYITLQDNLYEIFRAEQFSTTKFDNNITEMVFENTR